MNTIKTLTAPSIGAPSTAARQFGVVCAVQLILSWPACPFGHTLHNDGAGANITRLTEAHLNGGLEQIKRVCVGRFGLAGPPIPSPSAFSN